jgi:gamma-glutamyl-gamma-aminobutyraldehyde dehydrogenase
MVEITAAKAHEIAAELKPNVQAFIGGKFRPAVSKKTFDATNPATGDAIASVASCDAADVDLAAAAARQSFESGSGLGLRQKTGNQLS